MHVYGIHYAHVVIRGPLYALVLIIGDHYVFKEIAGYACVRDPLCTCGIVT